MITDLLSRVIITLLRRSGFLPETVVVPQHGTLLTTRYACLDHCHLAPHSQCILSRPLDNGGSHFGVLVHVLEFHFYGSPFGLVHKVLSQ